MSDSENYWVNKNYWMKKEFNEEWSQNLGIQEWTPEKNCVTNTLKACFCCFSKSMCEVFVCGMLVNEWVHLYEVPLKVH